MKDVIISFCESNGYITINKGGPHQCSATLHTFHTSSEVLNYIAQVAKQAWVSNEELGDLFRQIDGRLGFQENYCPFGKEEPPKARDELERIIHRRSKNADSQRWKFYREIQQRITELDFILENESKKAKEETKALLKDVLNSLWNPDSWMEN
jgi:hypothetical protein